MFTAAYIPAFAAASDIPYEDRPLTVDTAAIDETLETFYEDLEKADNLDKVFEDYNLLMEQYGGVNDAWLINYMETDKLNYGMESKYTAEEISGNYDEAVLYNEKISAAVMSILDSRYAEDFKEYWGEDRTAAVESINLQSAGAYKDFYDRYYDLIEIDADGAEFAALLKEVITYNSADEEQMTEEDEAYSESVYNYCKDVAMPYYYYMNKYINYGTHHGLTDISADFPQTDALEALSFVGGIDSRLQAAYEYMVRNGLCFYDGNINNYLGTTYSLRTYGDAGVVVSCGSDLIGTLIHEFGHFQCAYGVESTGEEMFFGDAYSESLVEYDSQGLELIATDYYDEIYGENADAMKFIRIVTLFRDLGYTANLTATEMSLYNAEALSESDEEIDEYLSGLFGDDWYVYCSQYFTNPGGYIKYSLTMFDVIQMYDLYLQDKDAGLEKYFEGCSYVGDTYEEATKKLGFVSAFDENAAEYLNEITDNIFESEYGIDYETALDYFENGTYLGQVYPTEQRVSVNGGEPQTLCAYSSGGYNYIRIRDLAALLSGTSAQFDVEYDEESYTVNIISGKPYTSDGTEMISEVAAVETAGMKASGTASLLLDGEDTYFTQAIFLNGWNCYRLRGLAENGIIDMDVDYDEENDVVLISVNN